MVEIEKNEQSITAFSQKIYHRLSELYDTYRNKLKPLIFVVENIIGKFPVQVLIEIRSYQDHIANCFLANKTETDCLKELNKANSHLQRSIADCYKILIQIYYPDKIASFFKDYNRINLCLVDDGRFLPELTKLEKIAKEKSLLAKQNEFDANGEISCTYFEEAVFAYENLFSHIEKHSLGLANAAQYEKNNSKEENRRGWKFAFISAILGVILGAAVAFIIQNWNAIILFIKTTL